MVTLGQKFKMQKNMLKTFVQDIAVVLGKKRLEKTANILKNESIFKMGKNCKQARAIAFAKWSFWVKN